MSFQRCRIFLCVLLLCCFVSSALSEGIDLSSSDEAPLMVLNASSVMCAANAVMLFVDGGDTREEAVMETTVAKVMREEIEDNAITLELFGWHFTFTDTDPDDPILGSGQELFKLQFAQNEDGSYSLLSCRRPESGMRFYKEINRIFSEDVASMLGGDGEKKKKCGKRCVKKPSRYGISTAKPEPKVKKKA